MLQACNLLIQSVAAACGINRPAAQAPIHNATPPAAAQTDLQAIPHAPLTVTTTTATIAATTAGAVALSSTAAAATFGGYSSLLALATAGLVATLLLTTPTPTATTPPTAQSAAAQTAAIAQIAALQPHALSAQPIDSTTLLPTPTSRSAPTMQASAIQARFAPAGFTAETPATNHPIVSLAEVDVPEPATALTLLVATAAAILARRRHKTP